MTGLLDRMESKNLVERVDDPNDRRVKRIFITSGALELKPEMDKISAIFRQQARLGLTAEDIAIAANVLKTMRANCLRIKEEAQSRS